MSQDDPNSQTPLALYLRDRDVPCPACGYNLRGATMDKCPECSRAITLQVAGETMMLGPTRILSFWVLWIVLLWSIWQLARSIYYTIDQGWDVDQLPSAVQFYFFGARIGLWVGLSAGIVLLFRGLLRRWRATELNRDEATLFSVRMILWAVALRVGSDIAPMILGWLLWV